MSELGHCVLSWGDRNRIERAVDQASPHNPPVRVVIEHNGQQYRVLVSLLLDQEAVLRARQARVGVGNN